MKFEELKIPGAYRVEYRHFRDERGSFVKNFNNKMFASLSIGREFKEQFYSVSKRNVLRGMHFQLPPKAHDKLVVCMSGEILDVILDLREGSPTYMKYEAIELTGNSPTGLFIPVGCAHGFFTRSSEALVHYSTTAEYDASVDSGVKWDSFGFQWPENNPLTSERDRGFVKASEFKTPFKL